MVLHYNLKYNQKEKKMSRDYRYDQSRRNWWDEKIQWLGLTRNEVMWVVVGIILTTLFFKFPVNWDFVFGLRHR